MPQSSLSDSLSVIIDFQLEVNSASDLPFVSSGKILREYKPPSPCVVITTGEQVEKTHCVERSAAPVWSSTFLFASVTEKTSVSFAIFHEGHKHRRPLCSANTTIRELLHLQREEKEVHIILSSTDSQRSASILHLRVEKKLSNPSDASKYSAKFGALHDTPTVLTTSTQLVRVLCFDGGGVRGLSSLLILRDLMEQFNKTFYSSADASTHSGPLRPCDVFELIVGTGTGGLSALLVGRLRMTVDEAIEQYIQLSRAVIKSPMALFHDSNVFEEHLRGVITRFLGSSEALLFDTSSSGSRTAVLAATSAIVDAPPHVFRSYLVTPPYRVLDVARATSATAGFSPSVSFGQPPIEFIDAGSVGYNNPTEVALVEAEKIWPDRDVDLVVSLGTGTRPIVNFTKGGGWQTFAKKSQQLMENCDVNRGLESVGTTDRSGVKRNLAALTSAYLRHGQPEKDLDRCVQAMAGRASINLIRSEIPVDKYGLQTYIRDNVQLLQEISSSGRYLGNSAVTIGLHRGKRLTDGRLVLVKTYEGIEPSRNVHYFSQDLVSRQRIWNPLLLQLVGTGSRDEWVPFQVYHIPGGQFESFVDWFGRTATVESICGLYDMRLSIRSLVQFQRDRSVAWSGEAEDLLKSSVVQVQHNGNQYRWTVIYTGEVFTGPVETISAHEPFFGIANPRQRELPIAFLRAAEAWADETRDLTHAVRLEMGNMLDIDPSTLARTLLKQGWLGTASDKVGLHDNIRLGDVGYINETGNFVVVANFHADLTFTDGGGLTWTHTASYSNMDSIKQTEAPGDMEYTRYQVDLWPDNGLTAIRDMAYENLDKQHAWKLLQRCASKIVSDNALVTTPDELMLVTMATRDIMVDLFSISEDGSECPTVYLFDYEAPRGDHQPDPPMFPQMHASFSLVPDWLDGEEGTETSRAEFEDGWDLQYEVSG